MRMAVLGRRGVVGALSLALLMVPGGRWQRRRHVSRHAGAVCRVAGERHTGPPPSARCCSPSHRLHRRQRPMSKSLDRMESPGTSLDHGDHTGESTGAEQGARDGPSGHPRRTERGGLPGGQRLAWTHHLQHGCRDPSGAVPQRAHGGLLLQRERARSISGWPGRSGYRAGPASSLPCESMPRVMLTKAPGRGPVAELGGRRAPGVLEHPLGPSGRHLDDSGRAVRARPILTAEAKQLTAGTSTPRRNRRR